MQKSVTDQIMYAGEFGTGKVTNSWSGVVMEASLMPGTIAEHAAVSGPACLLTNSL